jgi:hypothetical protein
MPQRSGADSLLQENIILPSAAPTTRVAHSRIRPVAMCLLLGFIWWFFYSYSYVEDDAFIHLEYARSLGEGHGFTFNGRVINGDTAPLWVVLLATFHLIGFGWVAGAKALNTLGILSALTGVWRIAGDFQGSGPSHRFLIPAAVLVVGINPYFVHWSFSGMEAATALGTSLWVIWAAFSPIEPGWRRLWLGTLLLSMAPLLRPELVLLAMICGPALLYQSWRLQRKSALSQRIIVAFLMVAVMSLPTLFWAAYALHAFGAIVPTTNAAKRGGGFTSVAARLASVYLVGFGPALAITPFVAKRFTKPGVPAIVWVLLLWPLACAAFYLVDHTSVQTRYCLLSMPCFGLAVLWLLAETGSPVWARRGFAAIVAVSIVELVVIVFPHVTNKVTLVKNISSAVAFIRDKLPPEAPIAVYGIGQFAFESQHPLIDIGGITRPGVLPYLNDLPATIRWAKSQGAQYYIGGDAPDADAVRVFSYPEPFLGWSLHRSRYDTATVTGIYRFAPASAGTVQGTTNSLYPAPERPAAH